MLQTQCGYGFGDAARFVPIDGLGTTFGYRAESATARADVSQQHEGRGLVIPALADIGALRRLANRVQVESARELFQVVKIIADWGLGSEPLGLGQAKRWAQLDLNEL